MNQAYSPGAAEPYVAELDVAELDAAELDAADVLLLRTAGNPNVPNPARVYNALLGGKDNFAVDRAVAAELTAAKPALLANVRANRAYLGRAVRYLAAEAGIRQFLDLGTGIPAHDNAHEVAQRIAPGSRVVYVDNDPIVIAHARALLVSAKEGMTAYLGADIRDPASILRRAAVTLDFTRPVAVLLFGVLYMIPDADRPYEKVAAFMDAVVPGSYLAISHPASDIGAAAAARAARVYDSALPNSQTNRARAQVTRFFDGLELVEPGVVQLNKWRPCPADEGPGIEDPSIEDPGIAGPSIAGPGIEISGWAGLGRKR